MEIKKILLPTTQVLLLCSICFFCSVAWSSEKNVSVRYAKGFSVESAGAVTLVTVNNPWPGAKIAFKYLLKPRGTSTPAGYTGYQVVEIPIQRAVALSTTFLAFFEQLKLLDTLVGFSDLSRVHSQKVISATRRNKTQEVGQGANLKVETVIDLAPDIIFTFGTGSFRDAHPKLIEAGLTVGVIGEYMESHPLGRSEWIKFLALFYDKTEEAEQIFTQLARRYQELTETTKTLQHQPTVLSGVPFSGRWFVAGGNSFVGQFFKDAGADYIWKETTFSGSQPMDIELVYERSLEADFWLNTGIWKSMAQAREADPRFLEMKALQRGNLFNNNKRINVEGGNDYWESGIMAPDVVLADLIHILNPQLLPDHQLIYYTHLQ